MSRQTVIRNDIESIAAQLDDTVPYYVQSLIMEIRQLRAHSISPLRLCGYCHSWNSRPCGEGCVWSANMPTLEQHIAAVEAEQSSENPS